MNLNQNAITLQNLLKEGSRHFSGLEESLLKNIEACKEITEISRTSMGPGGMNKIMVNYLGKKSITNNCSAILESLEVNHPAANMLVMTAKMQNQEYGDNTNYTISLAGELLRKAELLIKMGIHQADIVVGFRKGLVALEKFIEDFKTTQIKDVRNLEEVSRFMFSTVSSKQLGLEDTICGLVAKACINVCPKDPSQFNVDYVRIAKLQGSGVYDSEVLRGMILMRQPEGSVLSAENAKVVVFMCPIAVADAEAKSTVVMNDDNELMDFSKGEEKEMENFVKALKDKGVKCIIVNGTVSDLALHYLNNYEIMIVRQTSKYETLRICKSLQAVGQTKMQIPNDDEIGFCTKIYGTTIGQNKIVRIQTAEQEGDICTIVLRGTTQNFMDDIERAINNAIDCYRNMCRNPNFLPGAGSFEIKASKFLVKYASELTGLDQYAVKEFGRAFEFLPRTLSENNGYNFVESVANLHAVNNGEDNFGFNIDTGKGFNVFDTPSFIVDHLETKLWSIKLATDSAVTILRIDHIIMSKPAGGPKMKQGQNLDDD